MTTWIIPCNTKYYDVIGAFSSLPRIDWKQSSKIDVGDEVFVYVGRPYKAILFKCRVTKTNLPKTEIDDSAFVIDGENYLNYGNYMELELEKKFEENQLSLDVLIQNGLQGNVQGPRRPNESLQRLLDSVG
jgi:5-methylcytosine-specific restriction protein A